MSTNSVTESANEDDDREGPHEKDISIGVSKDSGYDDLMSFVIGFFKQKYGEDNVEIDFG